MTSRFAYVLAAVLSVIVVAGCGSSDEFYVNPNDTTPPGAPVITGSSATRDFANIWWQSNSESDLAGYNVYSVEGGTAVKLNQVMLTRTYFAVPTDTGVQLYVTAVDVSGNESTPSAPTHVSFHRSNESDPIERLPKEKPSMP